MSKRAYNLPEVVEKDEAEVRQIIALIQACSLPDDVKEFVIKCIELALWFPLFLKKKSISLHRLRVMIFGKGYTRKDPASLDAATSPATSDTAGGTEPVSPPKSTASEAAGVPGAELSTGEATTSPAAPEPNPPQKRGHGRMPHTVYEDCTEINLLTGLAAGDSCPTECGGKLGPFTTGVIIRIRGQNFAQVYRYHVEKLRCNLCGILVKAEVPPGVGDNKYDETFIALLAIMKYYLAIPFHRQENFQRILNLPLSDATQWDLIEWLAGFCYPAFNALKELAGNARLIHNDDTSLKILEVIRQIKEGLDGGRTGMYTTGILADYEGHKIALFLNGRQHSGENVGDILALRSPDRGPVLQMSDALSANIPKGMETILCNCLGHGFRKFEEILDYFGPECQVIVKQLSQVFRYDAQTRTLSPEERLLYHRQWSKPVMDELKQYMNALLDEKRVEPNSDLGKAVKYMNRHWEKLTRFLTVAGAPIDNNVAERMLKIAIRNRKSALFYKTVYSAGIGGSLIYTCDLAFENPVDYLVALQKYPTRVAANPQQWLPWNYRDTIALARTDDASPRAVSSPSDCLAAA